MNNVFLEKLNIAIAVFIGLTIVGIIVFRVIPGNLAKPIAVSPQNSNGVNATVNQPNQNKSAKSNAEDEISTSFYIPPENDFYFSAKSARQEQTAINDNSSNYELYNQKYQSLVQKQQRNKTPPKPSKEEILAKLKANPININTATTTDLELLPGIGPVLAQRIIDYRRKIGRFTSINQLIEVKGIGEKKLKSIKPYVRI